MQKTLSLRITGAAAVLAIAAGAAAAAQAAELMKPGGYPERTISIIVPYGAGGGSDQVARAWSSAMQKITGVNYQVENKPGGGGLAAMPDYIARPKDGYTILQQTDGLITAEAAGQIDFKLGADVTPLCATQATFSQIYIRPDEDRFKDWDSFVAYAKKNPGQATIANIAAEGGMEAMQWGAIEDAAGIKVKVISFDKPTERYAALIGGHTDALLEQPGDVRTFLEAGQMKVILNVIKKSPEAFKDAPSLTESGMAEVPVLQRVRLFWMHTGVAAERRKYLEDACEAAYNTKEYQDFNKSKYMHLARSFYKGDEAMALVSELVDAYTTLYKKTGLIK